MYNSFQRCGLFVKALSLIICLLLGTAAFSQTIYYVKTSGNDVNTGTSWNSAFKTLQKALETSNTVGDQIWVASGTYYPDEGGSSIDNFRPASFVMKNGLAIYGGFTGTETLLSQRNWNSNITILSGDIDQNDGGNFTLNNNNSFHVVWNNTNNLNSTAILDGFTITAGNANGVSPNNLGGGIANFSASPTIANCRITANNATIGGGLGNSTSSPAFTNCLLDGNKGSLGGGIGNNASSAPIFTNCLVAGNRANFGGSGIDNDNSSTTLINCTFSGNNTVNSGRAIYNYQSSLTVTNSILWGDGDGEIDNEASTTPVITYSVVQGLNPGGTGNLNGTLTSNNPLFIQQPDFNLAPTTLGNVRLQATSPCINIGNNAANSTTLDLDVKPRKIGVIDMGAYEFQPTSLATHYFRSIATGNWNAVTTWESSPVANFSSGLVSPATLVPGISASGITVRSPHIITVTENTGANKLIVNTGGSVQLNTGVVLTSQ